jgi:asparagine synthase (glutamine-hydrolysing)
MSGIAVIHNLDGAPASPQLLARMLDAIAHRAIDGRGSWINGATALGYACMRTTAEALEETQPYSLGPGADALCLVFDGRVDNRLELRKALAALGAEPRGGSDAELILAAWQCWAEESPQKIIGDFAYVIWDGPRHRMFCVRDISGIRPLFYYSDARMLLCGSELHQLLACPAVPREPNPPAIAEYMCATLTDASSTLFRHLRRLPPAHYLVADRRGIAVRRYYDLEPARTIRYGTDEQYAEHFLEVFKEAVRCRLRTLTPPAAELSGGLDSSSVVVTAAALQAEGSDPSPPLECFSIVYDEPESDERAYAQEVARATSVKCSFVAPTLLDYGKCLEQVRRYSDAPDYVNGAVFDGLRKELVRRGTRVVLTGLGGDQWLQGSEYYLCDLIVSGRWAELLRQLRSDQRFGPLNSVRARLLVLLRWGLKPMLPKTIIRLFRRLLGRLPYPYSIEPALAHAVRLRTRIDQEPQRPGPMIYSQRSIYDCWASPWLLHLLEMDDRSNAWAGVEGRHPFYDQRVLEFSFAIPEDQRARLNLTKFVLRKAMKGLLPELIRERRDKGQFGRIFIDTFKRVGGEGLFETMAMESKGWVSSERMQQLCRERLSAYPSNLWPLWTTFAVDLWFREVFTASARSAEPTGGIARGLTSLGAPLRVAAI